MELTELRINIPQVNNESKTHKATLLACFSLVFDEQLAIHSVKLIEGPKGVFLAMPNERKQDHCRNCNSKNHLLAKYCNMCGKPLVPDRHLTIPPGDDGKVHLFHDLIHPLGNPFRDKLLELCLCAYEKELDEPGAMLPIFRPYEKRRVS